MLSFRYLNENDAELTLMWRTHPDITRYMYSDVKNPSVSHQKQWINSINKREDYQGFVILGDGEPIGFLCFYDIDAEQGRCSTGSYIYSREGRMKYCATLHAYICAYAFYALGCRKILNYIMGGNEKVVRLQKLLGTRCVGVMKEHVCKADEYHDVHVFELLKKDWLTQKYSQYFSMDEIRTAYQGWKEDERQGVGA